MKLVYPSGATPLDPNEIEGLLLPLTTQADLNSSEKQAIFDAMLALQKSRKILSNVLNISGIKTIHKKMFEPVWQWAGEFRKSEKQIGVLTHQIQPKLHELCLNVEEQLKYNWEEAAAYFHHGLVYIHPFANGNGRHARLTVNLLALREKQPPPVWGGEDLTSETQTRQTYIQALRAADKGDLKPLHAFMFGRK